MVKIMTNREWLWLMNKEGEATGVGHRVLSSEEEEREECAHLTYVCGG